MKLRAPDIQRQLLQLIEQWLACENVRILDVGSGDVVAKNRRAGQDQLAESYARLISKPGYLGLDVIPTEAVQLVGDAHALPLADASLDGVLMLSVLEHLRHPHAAISEVYRVLRPGGQFFSYAPFYHPYHASPHDYFRFTQEGYLYLLRDFSQTRIISGGNYVAVLNDVMSHAFGGSRLGRLFAGTLVGMPLTPAFRLLDSRMNTRLAVGFAALATK